MQKKQFSNYSSHRYSRIFCYLEKGLRLQIKTLYQMRGRFIKIEKFGTFHEGERINYHYLGDIEGESVKGICRGINYEIKQNHQVTIHIHESITTDQGEKILLERVGISEPCDDLNRVMIRAGQILARTNSKKLGWINSANLFWDGDFLWNDRHFIIQAYEKCLI